MGCAWCRNIGGVAGRGGVDMYNIIFVGKRFEERMEMEQAMSPRQIKMRCFTHVRHSA